MAITAGALAAEGAALSVSTTLQAFIQTTGGATVLTVPASFSDDVEPDGASGGYTSHGVGNQSGTALRSAISFLLSTLPKPGVSKVELLLESEIVVSNGSRFYNVGPYGSAGLDNPQIDVGVTRFNRCDVSTNYFLNNDTTLRSTGAKTLDLQAAGVASLQSALNANALLWSLAIKQDNEAVVDSWFGFYGYTVLTPNDYRPKLRVTYANGKVITVAMQSFISAAGEIPKSIACSMQAFVAKSSTPPPPSEPSPWTIQDPEEGIIGFIFPEE